MPETKKHLLFHTDAREKVLRGATQLVDAMRITLGPRSKSVLIGRVWGEPVVCNDGVTIAKELDLPDPDENLGVRMMRQVAVRTGDAVGDGTTTATLIAHAVFAEGVRNMVAGASAVGLKRGLDRGLVLAIEALRGMSRPVTDRRARLQVATISAHNNPEIGEVVANAIERVGSEGVITVEEARGTKTEVDLVEGMRIDHGYLSPYFVTRPEKMECVLDAPLVLLHEKRIGSVRELTPVLEKVLEAGRALLIVAEDVEGEALATLVINRLHGALNVAAVKAPGFGDRRKGMMEDIACLCGSRFLSADLGRKLDQVALEDLGAADRVVLTRETCTIIGGHGDPEAIAGRLAQLRSELGDAKSDYDREKLEERIARLAGGVAVVRVGAPTEAEMKSLKEAYEDSISATKAAIAEGIVPGAGLALIRAAAAVEAEEAHHDGDVRTGLRVLRHALDMPTRQIAENSGFEPGVVVERMRSGEGNVGLDASDGRWVDLLEAGIVDATKAIRVGLENAVSVAGLLLLTEATLTEVPEKTAPAAAEL